MPSIVQRLAVVLIPALLVFGCRERETGNASADSVAVADNAAVESEGSDTAGAVSATQPAAATPTDASSRPVTVQDIDRWQKGMAGEKQAVQQTAAKMKTAKTSEDKLKIMMDLQEQSTAAAGAQAAGLDEERYKFVRSKLSDVVKYLVPPEIPGMDTAQLPQSQRDQLRAERESYLKQTEWAVPPDVVEALKPRAAELRKQDLELAFTRAGAIQ